MDGALCLSVSKSVGQSVSESVSQSLISGCPALLSSGVCCSVMRLPCPSFRSSSALSWQVEGSGSGSDSGDGSGGEWREGEQRWEDERAAAVGIPSVMGSVSQPAHRNPPTDQPAAAIMIAPIPASQLALRH